MKKLLILAVIFALSACAAPSVQPTSRNYVTSYEQGGCNSTPEWSCPQPKETNEGRGAGSTF